MSFYKIYINDSFSVPHEMVLQIIKNDLPELNKALKKLK